MMRHFLVIKLQVTAAVVAAVVVIMCGCRTLERAEVPAMNALTEMGEMKAVKVLQPKEDFISSGRFSVVTDTTRLALRHRVFGGNQSILTLWDYASGDQIMSVRLNNVSYDRAPSVSQTGQLMAYPLRNGEVALIRLPSGQRHFKDLSGHQENSVPELCFHRDGRRAVTAALDGNAVVWDLFAPEDDDVISQFEGHNKGEFGVPLTCLALSRDGRWALSGDRAGYAILWEIDTLKTVHRFPRLLSKTYTPRPKGTPRGMMLTGPNLEPVELSDDPPEMGDEIRSVAFFPDGSKVAMGSAERGLRLCDTASGTELTTYEWEDKTMSVTSIAISANGQYVLFTSDSHPKLWDWQANRIWNLTGHHQSNPNRKYYIDNNLPVPPTDPGGVASVAFSIDGKHAITGGNDGTIRFWALPE